MIEMLGVLAVIGVLSILGLAGFNYAMNKYRANETIHDVMIRASNVPMIWEDYDRNADYLDPFEFSFAELKTTNRIGYPVHTLGEPNNSPFVFCVKVSNVGQEVCQRILEIKPTDVDLIEVGASGFEPTRTTPAVKENCQKNGQMIFFFDNLWHELPAVCEQASDCANDYKCCEGVCKKSCGVSPQTPCECLDRPDVCSVCIKESANVCYWETCDPVTESCWQVSTGNYRCCPNPIPNCLQGQIEVKDANGCPVGCSSVCTGDAACSGEQECCRNGVCTTDCSSCEGSTDPCCGSTDECCGNADPCACNPNGACCQNPRSCACQPNNSCCDSADPCCGKTPPTCGACEVSDDTCSACVPDTSCACQPDNPCCGLTGDSLACCLNPPQCGYCEKSDYASCTCKTDEESLVDKDTSECCDSVPLDGSEGLGNASYQKCCPFPDANACTCKPASSCLDCEEGMLRQIAAADGGHIIASGGDILISSEYAYCCLSATGTSACGGCSVDEYLDVREADDYFKMSVSVQGGGTATRCCAVPVGTLPAEVTAYQNAGEEAKCCLGEVYKHTNGAYYCCPKGATLTKSFYGDDLPNYAVCCADVDANGTVNADTSKNTYHQTAYYGTCQLAVCKKERLCPARNAPGTPTASNYWCCQSFENDCHSDGSSCCMNYYGSYRCCPKSMKWHFYKAVKDDGDIIEWETIDSGEEFLAFDVWGQTRWTHKINVCCNGDIYFKKYDDKDIYREFCCDSGEELKEVKGLNLHATHPYLDRPKFVCCPTGQDAYMNSDGDPRCCNGDVSPMAYIPAYYEETYTASTCCPKGQTYHACLDGETNCCSECWDEGMTDENGEPELSCFPTEGCC